MRNFFLWTLRIITLPFRFFIVFFFGGIFVLFMAPIGLLLCAFDPETSLLILDDVKDVVTDADTYKSILFGFGR